MSHIYASTIWPSPDPVPAKIKTLIQTTFRAVEEADAPHRRSIVTPTLTETCNLLINTTLYEGREAILQHWDKHLPAVHTVSRVFTANDKGDDVVVWGHVKLMDLDIPFAMRFVVEGVETEEPRFKYIETTVDTGPMVKMQMDPTGDKQ